MRIIVDKPEKISRLVAERYIDTLTAKPDAVLGFAAGNTQRELYNILGELCAEGKLSFKASKAFCLDEFVGLDLADPNSFHSFMDKNLFSKLDFDKRNIFFPAADGNIEPVQYDELISAAGGIDLQMLGIGLDGHIGFNEPATPFDSLTHVQQLTDSTRGHLAPDFGSLDKVPQNGVTMGIKTIMGARTVIMMAMGEEKADIIHKMVYGKTVTYVPASMLQIHDDMTLYLDEAAASKLN